MFSPVKTSDVILLATFLILSSLKNTQKNDLIRVEIFISS